ncbi:hypothetical protein SPRG_19572 [Saprolegnia parasitica CBS 223.65]|uniref:Uncharacterized protein n=1 Tax=Saprolegnia parasitica (strain CBS 223.65) TaxID=695850 RepID=A0A067CJX8_SAPPC|nr:hypothetical protein SPRG_19572 [Saprolegnia parasitica CBS 223.65]KDO31044.1 hypothetical protein SPRG_19572 [Saprolegnia parasitica CBS 223.65]|eukprot:XP_012198305.1 hypothetical protein SPRG_19572 [Saprolegnia parasitica CBS 223.65]
MALVIEATCKPDVNLDGSAPSFVIQHVLPQDTFKQIACPGVWTVKHVLFASFGTPVTASSRLERLDVATALTQRLIAGYGGDAASTERRYHALLTHKRATAACLAAALASSPIDPAQHATFSMTLTLAIGFTISFLSSLLSVCAAEPFDAHVYKQTAVTKSSHVELSRQPSRSRLSKRSLSKSLLLTGSNLLLSEYFWLLDNLERLVHHATMYGLDMTTGAIYLKRLKTIRSVVATKPSEFCQWLPLLQDVLSALNAYADDFKRMDLWYQVIECDTVIEELREACEM